MANFTAADVKKLRDLPGRDDGQQEGARPRPAATSTRPSSCSASRAPPRPPPVAPSARPSAGLVATAGDALVELKSETDFVTKTTTSSPRPADRRDRRRGQGRRHRGPQGRRARRQDRRRGRRGPRHHHRREDRAGRGRLLRGQPVIYMHKRAADLPPAVGVLVEFDGRRDRRPQRCHADRRDEGAVPLPRRGPRRHRGVRALDRRGQPPARRASPSRPSPRSSRVASTASSRRSSCSSRSR